MIGYKYSRIIRDSGDANLFWVREVFVGTVDGFSRKSEGQSPDMDLRGDCS